MMQFDSDVLIAGAGPAGLALAIGLADAGLGVQVIDSQPRDALARPDDDGREIALTHGSVALLRTFGLWQRLQAHEVGRIRAARVMDGGHASAALRFDTRNGADPLGWIVPNHALRRVSFEAASERAGIRIVDSTRVTAAQASAACATLCCAPATADAASATDAGTPAARHARLVVAADSRFSTLRRQLGIGADMHDFGRTMIVCRMTHAQPHGEVAWECFDYARTLAVLPLPGDASSVVVTADGAAAARLMALSEADFAALVQAQFRKRLGDMQLTGPRHAYPLVAVYARRFAGQRSALIGDAAVGMHPVTAHGYNLGLQGVESLALALRTAHAAQQDIGAPEVLAAYARTHRRQTALIYHGTNVVARLFADTRAPQRLLRQAVLRGAQHLPPLKATITAHLTGRRRASA